MHELRPLSSQRNDRVEGVLDVLKSLAEKVADQSSYPVLLSMETCPKVAYTSNKVHLGPLHIVP
jgi:hypothetical protein